MKFSELNVYDMDTFGGFGERANNWHICDIWTVAILEDREVHYTDRDAYDIENDSEIVGIKIGANVEGWDGEIPSVTCTSRDGVNLSLDIINSICSDIHDRIAEAEEDGWDDFLKKEIEEFVEEIAEKLQKHGTVHTSQEVLDKITKKKPKKKAIKKTIKKKKSTV